MILHRYLPLSFMLALGLGCGSDDESSDGAVHTSTDTHATHDGSEGDTSSGGTTVGQTSSNTSMGSTSSVDTGETSEPVDVMCGDALVCSNGDVCIEDAFEPMCTNLEDPKGMCPPDENMTNCGGAGIPCCCGPTPAPEYRCFTPAGCGAAVDCMCLGEVCTDGRGCIALGPDPEHLFRCELPAAP